MFLIELRENTKHTFFWRGSARQVNFEGMTYVEYVAYVESDLWDGVEVPPDVVLVIEIYLP